MGLNGLVQLDIIVMQYQTPPNHDIARSLLNLVLDFLEFSISNIKLHTLDRFKNDDVYLVYS